jgi:hypothetical protein
VQYLNVATSHKFQNMTNFAKFFSKEPFIIFTCEFFMLPQCENMPKKALLSTCTILKKRKIHAKNVNMRFIVPIV